MVGSYSRRVNMAAVTVAGARWDDAAVGANSGTSKIAIPLGARLACVTTAATLYVAMDENSDAYTNNGATALNEDGAVVATGAQIPVPINATYMHLKGAGATSVTFYLA